MIFKPSTNALDARCKPYLVVAVGDLGGVRNDLFSYKEGSLSISEHFHFCFEVPLLLFVFFSYSRERYSRRERVERKESSSASAYSSTWLPFPSVSTCRIFSFFKKQVNPFLFNFWYKINVRFNTCKYKLIHCLVNVVVLV